MTRNPVFSTLAIVFGLAMFVSVAFADGDVAPPAVAPTSPFNPRLTNASPIEVSVNLEAVPDLPPFHRARIKSSAGKFAFLVPKGYRVAGVGEEHVTFGNKANDRFIKLRVIDGMTMTGSPEDKAGLRAFLATQYPEARVVRESTAHANNKAGPAFDLEWTIVEGVRQSARVLYVPCGTGVLEVSLIVGTDHFKESTQNLNKVLLTLRSTGPNGELPKVALSSRF